MPRRVPPLAAAIVLVAAALVATVWTTRSAVIDAFDAVRDGQALALEQAVRGDLADLAGAATSDDLAQILRAHEAEGLGYVAIVDHRGRVAAEAGTARRSDERKRYQRRLPLRRAWGPGKWSLVIEAEPAQADELRSAATRTLAIGGLAALTLIGVAIWLVRNELRQQRQRRLAALGEMSAVLAHEIRNPLASLKGNAQLLAASVPDATKPKAQRVVDEAVRLEKLTQELLGFVRSGELTKTKASPAAIVRDAAGEGVAIEDAAAPETWSLDAPRMREVIVNLLDNAEAAGPPVRARITTVGRKLVIDISDGGPGVRAEDRERIFEPFFTGKTRGTGLGLAIAKRIVELHHGTIRVDDGPDGGARFRIEIPEA